MLFTESSLNTANPLSLLDEAVYLTSSEAKVSPLQLPVTMVSESMALINYEYLNQLMEDYGCSLEEAKIAVQEANQITETNLVMAVPEYQAILHPELVSENSVILPISENDEIYQFCEDVMVLFEEFNDENILNGIYTESVEDLLTSHLKKYSAPFAANPSKENFIKNAQKGERAMKAALRLSNYLGKKEGSKDSDHMQFKLFQAQHDADMSKKHVKDTEDWANKRIQHKDSIISDLRKQLLDNEATADKEKSALRKEIYAAKRNGQLMALTTTAVPLAWKGGKKLYQFTSDKIQAYRNRPKSVIAKKIASLRHIYSKYLESAQKHPEKASLFKKIAAKILSVIDKLLSFLQAKADHR